MERVKIEKLHEIMDLVKVKVRKLRVDKNFSHRKVGEIIKAFFCLVFSVTNFSNEPGRCMTLPQLHSEKTEFGARKNFCLGGRRNHMSMRENISTHNL